MRYWIILEGGGTRTDGVLITDAGEVISSLREKGSNPLFLDHELIIGRIYGMICGLAGNADLKPEQISSVYCFVPGLRHISQRLQKLLPQYSISYYGDELPTLYGALGGIPGIVVLAGTGSFAVGQDISGNMVSVGGWGPLFSDYGSGYDIGRRLLARTVQQYDTGLNTELMKAVMHVYNIGDISELRGLQKDSKLFDRAHIAALCKIAADAAEAGNKDAETILSEAAGELALLAGQCSERLGMKELAFPCSLTGGVRNIGKKITEPFIKHLESVDSKLHYLEARYSSIVGACLYVQKENGCTMTGDLLSARLDK